MEIDTPAIRRLRDRIFGFQSAETSPTPSSRPTAQQNAALERVAPIVEAMALMMAADGEKHPGERRALRDAVSVLTSDAVAASVLDELLDRLERELSEQGLEARLEAVATQLALRRGDAEAAFSLAAAVGVSDYEVAVQEQSLLGQLRRYLGISETRARALLDGAAPVSAR